MALKLVTIFGPTPGGPFSSLSNWSEVYYSVAALGVDAFAQFVVAHGTPGNFVRSRTVIMSPGWSLLSIRVYDTENPRASSERTVNRKGAFVVSGTTDIDEQPYDRLLYRFNTAAASRWARVGAVPRGVVNAGGTYQGGAPPVTATGGTWHQLFVNDFQQGLLDNDIAMRRVNSSAPVPITDVQTTTVGTIRASPMAPVIKAFEPDIPGVVNQRYIKIVNAPTPVGLNGLWFVQWYTIVDGFAYLGLRPKRGLQVQGTYQPGGSFRIQSYSYAEVTSISPKRGVSRKPGRPFDLPRGRASSRRT